MPYPWAAGAVLTASDLNAAIAADRDLSSPPTIGNTTPNSGSFTSLAASSLTSVDGAFSTLSASVSITGPGALSTLSASGVVSGAGFVAWLASPPAIGGTAPNAGTFTTLTATSGLTLSATVAVTAATYTVLATDTLLVLNPSAGLTLTLGAATNGRVLWLKLISAFAVTSASSNVVPQASATAGTAILAATAGKFALLVGDGTNWQVMTSN